MTSKNLNTINMKHAVVPQESFSITKEDKQLAKEKLEKFIKEETRLVKGRFRCFETPGSSLRVQVKKYKDVPMFDKMMFDGGTYEIPLYVARHLNGVDVTAEAINGKVGTCSYPVHGFAMSDPNTLMPSSLGAIPGGHSGIPMPTTQVAKRVRRFGFDSLEFDSQVA